MFQRPLVLVLIVLCPFGRAQADDWPQWQGSERTNVSKETGLLKEWPAGGPKLLWTFRDAGYGYSCISVVGDRLYSMGDDGKKEYAYAVDLKTQNKLWSTEIGPIWRADICANYPGPRSTPTIDGDFLYTLGTYGNLVCVEVAAGKKLWSQELETKLGGTLPSYGYGESVLVDGDQVVATPGGTKGAIAAFDKKTGTLKWRTAPASTPGSQQTCSSMIVIEIGGVRQYVQILRDLVGVRASDGERLWQFSSGPCTNTPICWHNSVYLPKVDSTLFKIVPAGNDFMVEDEETYIKGKMENDFSGVVLVNGYLYGYSTSGKGGWICQEFKTGKSAWVKNPDKSMGKGSAIYADGNLYCYHENRGDVLLIKATPSGYQERGRFRIPERTKLPIPGEKLIFTRPTVANGKLYLRDFNLIFCYDVRAHSDGRILHRTNW